MHGLLNPNCSYWHLKVSADAGSLLIMLMTAIGDKAAIVNC